MHFPPPSTHEQTLTSRGMSVEALESPPLNWNKRLFDLVVAGLVTVFVLSWMIPLVSLLVSLTSPGPPLYIQMRTGRRGLHFACLKFRTMYYDRTAAFRQVTVNDARVTPIGRFLRRTNLDEMPQFLNVLAGTMSVVGPRPHAVHHDMLYWNRLANYPQRYRVLPGITGLAQVRGSRGLTSETRQMEHRVRYDHFYIQHWSLKLDVGICWQTFVHMLTGQTNAY